MSSSDTLLPNQEERESFSVMSDDRGLRDAAEIVLTPSAPSMSGAGRDEAKPNESDQTEVEAAQSEHVRRCSTIEAPEHTEGADAGSMSVSARGGPSDSSPIEPQKPADSIKTLRDFEAFLRSSGFSRAAARSIAKSGWDRSGETETETASDLDQARIAALIDLFRVEP